ncbi:hypothetical protein KAT24_00815 [Candidatus Pacearchaeota archaeon]|nr:hypothetical protein [Candidatus Pacearchaeota archaeon]
MDLGDKTDWNLFDTDWPDIDTSKIKENPYVLTDEEINEEYRQDRENPLP